MTDPRLAPLLALREIMPVPGRQTGDAKLLVEVERKTRGKK
jgi:hypothetical protein